MFAAMLSMIVLIATVTTLTHCQANALCPSCPGCDWNMIIPRNGVALIEGIGCPSDLGYFDRVSNIIVNSRDQSSNQGVCDNSQFFITAINGTSSRSGSLSCYDSSTAGYPSGGIGAGVAIHCNNTKCDCHVDYSALFSCYSSADPYKWTATNWGLCQGPEVGVTGYCAQGTGQGTQGRLVLCVDARTQGLVLNETLCAQRGGPKPTETQNCTVPRCPSPPAGPSCMCTNEGLLAGYVSLPDATTCNTALCNINVCVNAFPDQCSAYNGTVAEATCMSNPSDSHSSSSTGSSAATGSININNATQNSIAWSSTFLSYAVAILLLYMSSFIV